jgi:hypothetical protein
MNQKENLIIRPDSGGIPIDGNVVEKVVVTGNANGIVYFDVHYKLDESIITPLSFMATNFNDFCNWVTKLSLEDKVFDSNSLPFTFGTLR